METIYLHQCDVCGHLRGVEANECGHCNEVTETTRYFLRAEYAGYVIKRKGDHVDVYNREGVLVYEGLARLDIARDRIDDHRRNQRMEQLRRKVDELAGRPYVREC